jgi:hypothetical protein
MRLIERAERSGIDRITAWLLLGSLMLALLHHTDHVLRVDHSGWPFREVVTPFTFSLLAYPMILFALFGPRRLFWARWLFLALGTGFTIYAHTGLESPQMQFAMWAENRSLDPHAAGLHNIPGAQSPALGVAAVIVSMALNVVAVVVTVSMFAQGLRLRRG